MKNSTKNGMISIPETTLSALKNMLFTNENGIDLTNIINDLTVGCENKDLIAIHIALTHKGIKPDIDTQNRYFRDYTNFYELEYIGFSQIMGDVAVKRTEYKYTKDEIKKISETTYNIAYCQWLEYTTDKDAILKELSARFDK